jgi:hypothetical protein
MRARPLFRMLAAALVGGVLLAPPARAGADANPPPWDVTETPNQGAGANTLHGVTALSPTEAWAVGRFVTPQWKGRTLVERWNGQAWDIAPSPNPERVDDAQLEAVDGASPADVWAVGSARLTSGVTRTLIEHWNGSVWTIVSSPNSGSPSRLHDVVAVSATEAWAVGEGSTGSLILRWNGSDWSAVGNPCPFPLFGITAVAATDVWAVGDQDTCHRDGRAWSKVPGAPSFGDIFMLRDVSGAAAEVVWAVGGLWSCPYDCIGYGLIERWDGTRWTAARFPDVVFSGVVAISRTEAYAVGQDCCGRTLVLRWNGVSWTPAPNPSIPGSLQDAAATSGSDLWAVGQGFRSGPPVTLAEHAPSPTSGAVTGDTHVGGATVSWFGPESGSTQSELSGVYVVAGLTPGTYNLVATFPGCSPASATVTVSAGVTLTQNLPVVC